ncbi:MAG: hypothetical protein QG593_692 [Patescibacteria group bacterium]|jgi:hypothetical protein|nr:hypothetical protein [Patescibacteria group bacterium]
MKDINRIIPFLLEANKAGYANDKPQIEKQTDGTHRIVYERDDFRFEDLWWGGNPFSGQESIAIGGRVMWAMQYRGWMESGFEAQSNEVFQFLRRALKHCTVDDPLRGPKELKEDKLLYVNSWSANLNNFHGEERILKENQHVYSCKYFGGVVDEGVS